MKKTKFQLEQIAQEIYWKVEHGEMSKAVAILERLELSFQPDSEPIDETNLP